MPITNVKLLSVPFSYGDGQQLDFATVSAQAQYFTGRARHSFTDFSYQRRERFLRIPAGVDSLRDCNYVMYQNSAYSNKWFYAFILRMEYVNDGRTDVYIEDDPFQTWLFDFALDMSFVERETTRTDNLWEHTLPEPVPGGEHVAISQTSIYSGANLGAQNSQQFAQHYRVCFAASRQLRYIQDAAAPVPCFTGGGGNACIFYAMDFDDVEAFVEKVATDGQAGDIVAAFPVPRGLTTFTALSSAFVPSLGYLGGIDGTVHITSTVSKNTGTINGYTPRNKKLFCYPYNYLEIQSGDSRQELRYEICNNKTAADITFRIYYALSVAPTYGAVPTGYAGKSLDEVHGVTMQNFPPIAWSYDAFANYLALHSTQIALSAVNTAADMATNAASGNIPGIAGDVGRIAEQAAVWADQSKQPRQMRGQLTGSWLAHIGKNDIYANKVCIKAEVAQIIDEFFTLYGYRVDTLKTPSFKNRPYFDYLKTRRVNISGDIPAEDMTKLQALFDGGLTVWHDATQFGNYLVNNAPT